MGARPGWAGVSREDKRSAETLPQRMSQKNVKDFCCNCSRPPLQGDRVVSVGRGLNWEVTSDCADK